MTTLSVTSLAMAVWSALRRAVAKVRYALPLAEGTAPQSSVTKISGASGLSISGGDEFALGMGAPYVDRPDYALGNSALDTDGLSSIRGPLFSMMNPSLFPGAQLMRSDDGGRTWQPATPGVTP